MRVRKLGWAALLAVLMLTQVSARSHQTNLATVNMLCHFGIAAPHGHFDYDLSILGVGAYLDWGASRRSGIPANITFFHVLRVDDKTHPSLPASMPDRLAKYPGAIWIIGNEPDSEVTFQDHISAESYGERYFALATIIRSIDPTAKIAFGTVIQPTAIRMAYLEKAINRMTQLAGGDRAKALGLIDIYSIHAFILNEERLYDDQGRGPLSWGAGLPIGYNPNDPSWGKPEIIKINDLVDETWKTHNIDIYKQRIFRFRQWMKTLGEQNKPLWITEYGSLFPSEGQNFLSVSDADTADFMEETFDFTLRHKDSNLGYAGDDYRLVQQLVWYSLNEYRTVFGGSLYDPTNLQLTMIGERFINYNPPVDVIPPGPVDIAVVNQAPRLLPAGRGTTPGTFNFRLVLRATNLVSSDRLTGVKLDLYEGDRLVGSTTTNLPRCAGQAVFTFNEYNFTPGAKHNYRAVLTLLPGNGTEMNPANQDIILPPVTVPNVKLLFLPTVTR